jgi:hypothetical protein
MKLWLVQAKEGRRVPLPTGTGELALVPSNAPAIFADSFQLAKQRDSKNSDLESCVEFTEFAPKQERLSLKRDRREVPVEDNPLTEEKA